MKKLSLLGVVVFGLFLMAGSAFAVDANQNLTINATVSATAKLSLTPATISFPDADPDTVTSIGATQNPVAVTAKGKTSLGSNVSLTVLANGDLTAGLATIAISNVTWTATGSGFAGGTMNKTTAQSAGSWANSGNRSGEFNYFLANSWDYSTGSYSQTVTYTLSSP